MKTLRLFVGKYLLLWLAVFALCHSNILAQNTDVKRSYIIVSFESEDVIKIISPLSGEIINTIETPDGPNEIALSPDGRIAIVSNYGKTDGGKSLTVIDLDKHEAIKTIDLGYFSRPHGISFLPNPNRIVTTLAERNSLALVDLDSGIILEEIQLNQKDPHLTVVDPNKQRVYVTNRGSGSVSVIDLEDFKLIKSIPTGRGTEGIDISPDGNEVWVTNKQDDTISIINTNTLNVIETIECKGFPVRLKFTHDGRNVLVSNIKWGYVAVFSAKKRKLEDFIVVNDLDVGISTEYDLFHVPETGYVELKTTTYKDLDIRLKKLRRGDIPMPFGITMSSEGYVFVSYKNKNLIAVVGTTGLKRWKVIGLIDVGSSPDAISYSNIPYASDAKTGDVLTDYWDNNRPVAKYFQQLDDTDENDFLKEYEYPFIEVIPENRLEEYNDLLTLNDKKEFLKNYIREKDANPLLPANYWFLEFYSRCAYVRDKFSRQVPPYFDDRGKYYLKYGRPDRRYEDRGGIKRQSLLNKLNSSTIFGRLGKMYNGSPPDKDFHVNANETWTYFQRGNDIVFHFVNEGYFKKVNSMKDALLTAQEKNAAWQWMQLVKERVDEVPSLYDAYTTILGFEDAFLTGNFSPLSMIDGMTPHAIITDKHNEMDMLEMISQRDAVLNIDRKYDDFNVLAFNADIAQFKDIENKIRIESFIYIPIKDNFDDDYLNKTDSLSLNTTIMIRDNKLEHINTIEDAGALPISLDKIVNMQNLVNYQSFFVKPGENEITFQIDEGHENSIGFKKELLKIRDFSGDSVLISDIQFYTDQVNDYPESVYPSRKIDELRIIPYPLLHYSKNIPILCYFEIYNLVKSNIGPLFDIELKLRETDKNRSIVSRLIRSNKEEYAYSIRQSREVTTDISREIIGMDLSSIKNGEYTLVIDIISIGDNKIQASIEKTVRIKN